MDIETLTCIECRVVPCRPEAKGWRAFLVDLDDDGQDEVVFYCPACSEREFAQSLDSDDV